MKTVAIIGAGASGLACMNILNQTQQFDILVLEQSAKSAKYTKKTVYPKRK